MLSQTIYGGKLEKVIEIHNFIYLLLLDHEIFGPANL